MMFFYVNFRSILFILLLILIMMLPLQMQLMPMGICSERVDHSTSCKPYRYRGTIYFNNGTYIDDAIAIVSYKMVNSTMVVVFVNITGKKCILSRTTSISKCVGNVTMTLRFLVDIRTNYAWLNGRFIGFFPFYIFPTLTYDNVTKYKFVYLDEQLRVTLAPNGKPIPVVSHPVIDGKSYTLSSLELSNDYLDMYFVYHYPINVWVDVPLNGSLAKLELSVMGKKCLLYILSIDDYPTQVSYIDWTKLPIVIAIFGGFALLGYSVVVIARRFRKR